MKDFSEVSSPRRINVADGIPQLAEILPVRLQWWRKSLEPFFNRQETLWMRLWSDLKTRMEADEAPDCFVKRFIETNYLKMEITELQAAFLAGCML